MSLLNRKCRWALVAAAALCAAMASADTPPDSVFLQSASGRVTQENMNREQVTNPLEAINGRVAGLTITKANNGVVVYCTDEAREYEESPCIRCGRCVDACPIGLTPWKLKLLCENNDLQGAGAENVMDCVVCGSCSYICPAHRRLTPAFKGMKDKIAAEAKKGKG